jgi:hypothetical protein
LDDGIAIKEFPVVEVVVEEHMLRSSLGYDPSPKSRDFIGGNFGIKLDAEKTDFF